MHFGRKKWPFLASDSELLFVEKLKFYYIIAEGCDEIYMNMISLFLTRDFRFEYGV